MGRLIVNHEEIKGFMAAMEMSYPVAQPQLLDGVNPGDKIEFAIDPAASRIIGIKVIEPAK
jgi:Cu/Ag efflux protein CusF